ncbi:MAG: cytidylate kinase-like family protein [Prevotella sp.]|nr:cytidylate kinase-like family protein [Prevotella sp.]
MKKDSNKTIIINVGRQMGSGGHEIGRMLANDFAANYYDKEILNLAAKESGFSAEYFEQSDERHGFLRSLFHMHAPHVSDNNFYQNNFSQEGLFKFQSDAIRKEAGKGSCVFVGRCADYVLRDFDNVVNIFITASMQFRIDNIVRRRAIQPEEAQKVIEQEERRRAEYYNYYTGRKWGMATGYDLCIDASVLGIVATERFIASFVRAKFGLESTEALSTDI